MFDIQSAPAIPASGRGAGARKYPFADMTPEDGKNFFFIPDREKNNMATHAATSGKKLGKRFVTRSIYMHETAEGWAACAEGDEDAIKGIGVWCVEPKPAKEEAPARGKGKGKTEPVADEEE